MVDRKIASIAAVSLVLSANIYAGQRTNTASADANLLEAAKNGDFRRVQATLSTGVSAEAKQRALFLSEIAAPLLIDISAEEPTHPHSLQTNIGENAREEEMIDYAKTVRALLDAGVQVEARDENGQTPLIVAASHGQTEIVKVLLEKGANVDAEGSQGGTALIAAACSCAIIDMPYTLDAIVLLVEKHANVNARTKDGSTALMGAAGWGRSDIAEFLLNHGAQIDAANDEGYTALLIAASGSALPTADVVKLLLTRGANVEAKTTEGDTALLLTASQGGYEGKQILELLLEKRANPHVTDKRGDTPLALAIKSGFADFVPLLQRAMNAR
jgi:ankyrin repeat protein